MDARAGLQPLLAEGGAGALGLGHLALVGQEHLRPVLAPVLGDGHLAGQLQAGAGDAVLRDDLDRPAAGEQVVGDPLAAVAELEPGQVERGVGQRAEAVDVVGEVVHELALLAAELQRLDQRRPFRPVALASSPAPADQCSSQVGEHRVERLAGRLRSCAAGAGRS